MTLSHTLRACAGLALLAPGILGAGSAQAAPGGPDGAATPPAKSAPSTTAAPVLAGHRAVYDLSLASSGGTRSIDAARGRIAIDFKGDACKGYTMQTRQVTVLNSSESGDRTSDLRNTTFESGDGEDFRFKSVTEINGAASQSVDGTAEAGADLLKVKLKEPKRDGFQEKGRVLLPSFHMRRLIEAARAGETTLQAKVFDGSDDGRKVYDTLAVIGRQASAPASVGAEARQGQDGKGERDQPLRAGEMAAMPRWPVTLSYFTGGGAESTPIYTLTFDLYENGVSGALKLDYGDFAIVGDMTRLDLDKSGEKAGAKPCAP